MTDDQRIPGGSVPAPLDAEERATALYDDLAAWFYPAGRRVVKQTMAQHFAAALSAPSGPVPTPLDEAIRTAAVKLRDRLREDANTAVDAAFAAAPAPAVCSWCKGAGEVMATGAVHDDDRIPCPGCVAAPTRQEAPDRAGKMHRLVDTGWTACGRRQTPDMRIGSDAEVSRAEDGCRACSHSLMPDAAPSAPGQAPLDRRTGEALIREVVKVGDEPPRVKSSGSAEWGARHMLNLLRERGHVSAASAPGQDAEAVERAARRLADEEKSLVFRCADDRVESFGGERLRDLYRAKARSVLAAAAGLLREEST